MSSRLSNVDAAWLHMERPTNLMVITGVLWFDTVVEPAQIERVISARVLERFPKFRQRVVEHAITGAHWEDDPTFALESHIHRVALPAPGGRVELQQFVSDLMSTPLDKTKPLWQLHVVEGLDGGSAIVVRIHHCIGDGMALARLLLSLTDDADAAEPPPAPAPEQPSLWHRALDAVAHPSQIHLSEIARTGARGVEALGKLLFTGPDRPSCLRGDVGVPERAAWTEPVSLDVVKAIGQPHGATVNDVLVAAVTGAIHHYLLERHCLVDSIRAVVPVNLRPLDEPLPRDLGNRFGLVFLDLPVGLDHRRTRLLEVKRRMDAIKQSPEAVVAYGVLQAMGATPVQLERAIIDVFGKKATAVMTNVPGPCEPVYLAGHRVAGLMFFVPRSGDVALGVSIFSYARTIVLGVSSDAAVIDRPDDILTGFTDELRQIPVD